MKVFISNRKKLHVSAYSGHIQVLTNFLLKEFYITCLNRVVMLRSHHHFTCFFQAKLVGVCWVNARKLSKPEDGR